MNEKFRDVNYGEGRSGCGCNDNDSRQRRDRVDTDCGCDRDAREGGRGRADRESGHGRADRESGRGRADRRSGERCCDRDERARLLKKVQQLNFMMIEAGLFLNNQCDCEAAQEAFCEYQRRHAEAKAEYEKYYGPLTYEGINVKRDGWSWINGPWPWEVEDC